MKAAIYPGSFDPLTIGHISIVKRASALFDELYVVILNNRTKKPLFTSEERYQLAQKSLNKFSNVKVVRYDGLTLDFARQVNACALIRGIRSGIDYEYEQLQALCNRHIDAKLETIFLMSEPEYAFISSSAVKEFASYHQSLDGLVSDCVKEALIQKFK